MDKKKVLLFIIPIIVICIIVLIFLRKENINNEIKSGNDFTNNKNNTKPHVNISNLDRNVNNSVEDKNIENEDFTPGEAYNYKDNLNEFTLSPDNILSGDYSYYEGTYYKDYNSLILDAYGTIYVDEEIFSSPTNISKNSDGSYSGTLSNGKKISFYPDNMRIALETDTETIYFKRQ